MPTHDIIDNRRERLIHRVWFCRGIDIAQHWRQVHPYIAAQGA
jgi:hypothetical protein